MAIHSEVVYSCASTCACVIELAEVCVTSGGKRGSLSALIPSDRYHHHLQTHIHHWCVKRWMACLYITVAVKKKNEARIFAWVFCTVL